MSSMRPWCGRISMAPAPAGRAQQIMRLWDGRKAGSRPRFTLLRAEGPTTAVRTGGERHEKIALKSCSIPARSPVTAGVAHACGHGGSPMIKPTAARQPGRAYAAAASPRERHFDCNAYRRRNLNKRLISKLRRSVESLLIMISVRRTISP